MVRKSVTGDEASPVHAAATGTATLLAPGFRFHPTDEEFVLYYLKRKVQNKPARYVIEGVEIYKHEPWQLAEKLRDEECYFFKAVDQKYSSGDRMNRKTDGGYWKITGKDREIIRELGEDESLIGIARTLVFHQGCGTRTNWVMHEYRLVQEDDDEAPQQDAYVLCRVFENLIDINEHPRKFAFDDDDDDDDDEPLKSRECLPPCVVNTKAPLPLKQYKRKRQNSNNYSSQTSFSSTIADFDASVAAPLLEKKEPEPVATVVPPPVSFSSSEVMSDLQKENREMIVERFDLMYAQMMVETIQGRINALREENEELRKKINKDSS